jgi:hypothetical protein
MCRLSAPAGVVNVYSCKRGEEIKRVFLCSDYVFKG